MLSTFLASVVMLISCSGEMEDTYVVLASSAVQQDAEWLKVAEALTAKHGADLVFYDKAPREVLAELQKRTPRYVAIVEKPEEAADDNHGHGHAH